MKKGLLYLVALLFASVTAFSQNDEANGVNVGAAIDYDTLTAIGNFIPSHWSVDAIATVVPGLKNLTKTEGKDLWSIGAPLYVATFKNDEIDFVFTRPDGDNYSDFRMYFSGWSNAEGTPGNDPYGADTLNGYLVDFVSDSGDTLADLNITVNTDVDFRLRIDLMTKEGFLSNAASINFAVAAGADQEMTFNWAGDALATANVATFQDWYSGTWWGGLSNGKYDGTTGAFDDGAVATPSNIPLDMNQIAGIAFTFDDAAGTAATKNISFKSLSIGDASVDIDPCVARNLPGAEECQSGSGVKNANPSLIKVKGNVVSAEGAISIVNMAGQVVLTGEDSVDLSPLAKGVYKAVAAGAVKTVVKK